jgi:hypothetical protein
LALDSLTQPAVLQPQYMRCPVHTMTLGQLCGSCP